MKKRILSFFAIGLCIATGASAQSIAPSNINSNGGFTTIGGNSYEWSIGEMVLVHTATAGNVVITQGLLQPNKHSGGSAVSESQFIFDRVKVYPNPAENMFFLDADFKESGVLQSILYDLNGKIIEQKEIAAKGQREKLSYNISALSAGNYMLIVSFTSDGNQKTISKAAYKIEKTN